MSELRHALLINYHWPPCGGPGVHRWLRFSRYFQENGWKLTVYAPENAAWTTVDEQLVEQIPEAVTVIRQPIFEPQRYLSKNLNPVGQAGLARKKKSFLQDLVIWIRGNVFIPDARVFWIAPSVRFLDRYLKAHPDIEVIISSGPPHSLHLIAQRLKQKHPSLRWIADFRDPWTQIDFYQELLPGKRADSRQKALEKSVLTKADCVVTVSEACAEGLEAIVRRPVKVITNGYDFPEFEASSVQADVQFTIAHFGSMPASRNPEVLWHALGELVREHPGFAADLKIRLVGSVDLAVFDSARRAGLTGHLEHIATVPHSASIDMQRQSRVLLLVGNNTGNVKGILTGKVFEYLGARRPILTIGQRGSNLEKVISETSSGKFVGFDEAAACKAAVREMYEAHRSGTLSVQAVHLEKYTSRNLAREFCDLLK